MALKQSNAKWKIVVGHHTIRSAGHHGDTEELVNQLLPILEVIKMHSHITFTKREIPKKNSYIYYALHSDINFMIEFQANDVDLFMNGHDHCLQHISSLNRFVDTQVICI